MARPLRISGLTAFRAAAAAVVFGFHANYDLIGSHGLSHLTSQGISGVSFFFILSGFVLMWSARREDDLGSFWRRRAARILPLYYLAWLVALILSRSDPGMGTGRNQLISLTLLQSWVHNSSVYYSGNRVAWSLSCEVFFYLAFPFIAMLVHSLSVRALRAGIGVVAIAAILVPIALYPPGATGDRYWIYIFPPTRLLEFLIGVLAAALVQRNALPQLRLGFTVVAAVLMYLLAGWLPYCFQPVATTVVPYTAVIVAATQLEIQLRAQPSRHRPIPSLAIRLGEWSYAFYLVHQLVLRGSEHIYHPWGKVTGGLWSIVGLGASVAIAALLCERLEKPLERRLRGDHSLPDSLTV